MSTERFEHRRREDGELLGWIEERGDGFVAIDRFGRELTGVADWFEAESALVQLGLSYLAERHSRFCNTDFDDKLACLNLSGV